MSSSLIGINQCNLGNLEILFFSKENIDNINNLLISEVYRRTNNQYKIVKQSERSLLIVMQYVYLEHSTNLPMKVKDQLKVLNDRVIYEVVPDIITAITQYSGYIKDINRSLEPPPLPINSSKSTVLKPMLTLR
jgi:hypothetical protein